MAVAGANAQLGAGDELHDVLGVGQASLGRIVTSTTGDEPSITPPGELPDARDDGT